MPRDDDDGDGNDDANDSASVDTFMMPPLAFMFQFASCVLCFLLPVLLFDADSKAILSRCCDDRSKGRF